MLKGKTAEFYVFRQQFEQLQLSEDDLLVIKRPSGPVDLYDRAFDFAHNHPLAGHFGVNATLERLKRHMYWVGQAQYVENKVRLCATCWNKNNTCTVWDAQHMPRRVGFPLEILFVDLVGLLNPSADNFMYILSVQDGFSRFLMLFPLHLRRGHEDVNRKIYQHFRMSSNNPL